MYKNFGGVIWTNHALDRLRERGIPQGDAWSVWKRPDLSRFDKEKNAWVFTKTYGNQRLEVVAKENEKQEWVILSVWSRQILSNKKSGSFLRVLLKKIFS